MRIYRKAAVSATAAGLLAFGVISGGGTAFASPIPTPFGGLITVCEATVANVSAGYEPNCQAGGVVNNPTSLTIDVDTDGLGALLDDQEGQAMNATWELSCVVNGATVTSAGSYSVTSTTQEPETTIDLQTAVGSPEPTQCGIEVEVSTALPLNDEDIESGSFEIGVAALGDVALPGAIWQKESATNATLCADDTANGNAGAKIQSFLCQGDLAESFVQTSTGQLVHNGDCLGLSGSNVILAKCTAGKVPQTWSQTKTGGTLMNKSSGTCLTAPSVKSGIQLTVRACGTGASQQWNAPAAPVVTPPPAYHFHR